MMMIQPPRTEEARFQRQGHVFPPEIREETAVVCLGGEANTTVAWGITVAAACMGVPAIACDHDEPGLVLGEHPLAWPLDAAVRHVYPDCRYHSLDPAEPAADVRALVDCSRNAWIIVLLNHPAAARARLEALREAGIGQPVLSVLTGPGGLVVARAAGPTEALESPLWSLPGTSPGDCAPGPPELGVAAAGLVLNRVMRAEAPQGEAPLELYSLHRDDRVTGETKDLARLTAEASRPAREPESFTGRRLHLVGAGAVANWALLSLCRERALEVVIHDGDGIEESNLNRQPLLSGSLEGGESKAEVAAEVMGELAPDQRYRAKSVFVRRAKDLGRLEPTDLVLAAVDNDRSRLVCADAAAPVATFATAGTSPRGAGIAVTVPGGPCYRCVAGLGPGREPEDGAGDNPCEGAVVATNAVAAGLLVSELRQLVAGGEAWNLRYDAEATRGNSLHRAVNRPRCPHRGGGCGGQGGQP